MSECPFNCTPAAGCADFEQCFNTTGCDIDTSCIFCIEILCICGTECDTGDDPYCPCTPPEYKWQEDIIWAFIISMAACVAFVSLVGLILLWKKYKTDTGEVVETKNDIDGLVSPISYE